MVKKKIQYFLLILKLTKILKIKQQIEFKQDSPKTCVKPVVKTGLPTLIFSFFLKSFMPIHE